MKELSILFACLLLSLSPVLTTQAQQRETKNLIREVKKVIRQQALVRDAVDWALLESQIKRLPFANEHHADKELVYEVFREALRQAGDRHSLFYSGSVARTLRSQSAQERYASAEDLGDGIGYLCIPACMSFDYQKDRVFADTLISQIRELDQQGISGWIIDLRGNRGGNVWPMLAGLSPIIGEGVVTHTITGRQALPSAIRYGRINHSSAQTQHYQTRYPYHKIAVMTDGHTASSGELLAIALLGLDRVRAFGHPTSGLTTSNKTIPLKDGSLLFLATGYMADRHQRTYPDGIFPDESFPEGMSEEEKISMIREWLLKDD